MPIYDIFQKGLRRGAEHLPHDPNKAYAYVEHPVLGWRVYIRSAMFLHEDNQMDRFLVFRNSKSGNAKGTWEPPKGQMEGKDLLHKPSTPLITLMMNALRREVEEEAHCTDLEKIRYTGLVFQSREEDYPENWVFQYHLFQAHVNPQIVQDIFHTFSWMKEHPKAVKRWRRDRKETDAAAWFHPKKTKLNPRWCPTIVFAYLKEFDRS